MTDAPAPLNLTGRRRPDSLRSELPDDIKPGDYWRAMDVELPPGYAPGNLTRTAWYVVAPELGFGVAILTQHTVREEDDGTISVRPGDGSSNSILVTGAHGKTWHGYIEHGEWRKA